ncbi:MAG TPA: hypothetical protein VG605_19060, partial [Puia sp.]|nr:hypothetical protein [Puia sp.]
QNNKGFWIERSGGDSSWASIGFLPTANAGGNSSMETTYQYLDRQAAGMARAAYRLRQEDLDGNLTYSEIAVVNLLNSAGSVAVYAYSDQIKIEFASAAQFRPCHVIVYDTQGRTLKRIFVQSAGVTVVHDLPRHNVYYVALNSGDGQRRVMKAVYVN